MLPWQGNAGPASPCASPAEHPLVRTRAREHVPARRTIALRPRARTGDWGNARVREAPSFGSPRQAGLARPPTPGTGSARHTHGARRAATGPTPTGWLHLVMLVHRRAWLHGRDGAGGGIAVLAIGRPDDGTTVRSGRMRAVAQFDANMNEADDNLPRHRDDFGRVYDLEDPSPYFNALGPSGYRMPEVLAGALTAIHGAVCAARGSRGALRMLDFACGYGAVGALLRHDVSMAELYARYAKRNWRPEEGRKHWPAGRRVLCRPARGVPEVRNRGNRHRGRRSRLRRGNGAGRSDLPREPGGRRTEPGAGTIPPRGGSDRREWIPWRAAPRRVPADPRLYRGPPALVRLAVCGPTSTGRRSTRCGPRGATVPRAWAASPCATERRSEKRSARTCFGPPGRSASRTGR